MNQEEIRTRMNEIEWFHTIDLGHGLVTSGCDDSRSKLAQLHLPDDMSGLSVLDIGAWNGFFSFEAERRGAERVVAVDSYSWSGEGWGTKAGFTLAREALGSRVEDREMEVLDLSPDALGTFDIVLFLGVLYHMKYPRRALAQVASVTADLLVLETHMDLLSINTPSIAMYPRDELNNDTSNWCGPNQAAIEWMLEEAGFSTVKQISLTHTSSQQGRAVYHARKVREKST